MEKRSSCCSRSYASTPKKEPVAVTPKKEEVAEGNVPASAAAVAVAAVKTPKAEQKEPVKANVGSGGCM
ncbi:hypothetical protein CCACVL1_09653 [Corchorus capsularis]|uniref:Uncharacterized protein n=1 Tax=Corchorus capsularis TaxID=210143 RepID=A0A1R3IUP9_COCAP|nr:hypothetical protein CCACVL1_09653 [Corchorus capsularis]